MASVASSTTIGRGVRLVGAFIMREAQALFGLQHQAALPSAGEFHIHLGQQFAVEQRVMCGAGGEIDVEAAAQRVQAVRHARKAGFRQHQRVDHALSSQMAGD